MASAGATTAAAAAAAERRRRLQEEEELMTPYSREDLDNDFEFKIVRANSGVFGKPEVFNRLIEEEAGAGWQLVEKFDNQRVRFKRPRSARQRDAVLPPGVDPYRVQWGLSESVYSMTVALSIVGAMALIILGIILFQIFAG
jgi:hypothetical protein